MLNSIENFKKIISFLKPLPYWLRMLILVFVVSLLFCFTLVSCGAMTSATIRHIQPNTNTSISIQNTTQMDTDVNTTADVSSQINPIK